VTRALQTRSHVRDMLSFQLFKTVIVSFADRHAKIKVTKGARPELYSFYDAPQPDWD
jgi:hypothetical protein